MAKQIVKTIEISSETSNYIEALFEDYMAKKDLIATIFDLHKYDADGSILSSIPFKNYEKEFAKIKVEYDTAIRELANTYIPPEYQKDNYNFEVNFINETMDIYIQ